MAHARLSWRSPYVRWYTGTDVPDNGEPVIGGGSDLFSVGTPGNDVDSLPVAAERLNYTLTSKIPEFTNGPGTDQKPPAIRAPRHSPTPKPDAVVPRRPRGGQARCERSSRLRQRQRIARGGSKPAPR